MNVGPLDPERNFVTFGSAIACSLTSEQLGDRRTAWQNIISTWGLERRRLPDRIRLTFRPAPGVVSSLRHLTQLEAECCPWMSFDIRDQDPVVLDVSAEGDGLAAVGIAFQAG